MRERKSKVVTVLASATQLDSSDSLLWDVEEIAFEPGSQLRRLESETFANCQRIRSICIPSSVEFIARWCFVLSVAQPPFCPAEKITFEAVSKLRELDEAAFAGCSCLRSLSIPSSVEIIGKYCFWNCSSLEEIVFQSDSQLVRIGGSAFLSCSAIPSISLPPLVEAVGDDCFSYCEVLSTLTFSYPCRVRELLALPPRWSGVMEIPDSVEILRFWRWPDNSPNCSLAFGCESRLREFRSSPWLCSVFVSITSRSLKILRSNIEFVEFDSESSTPPSA
jgi:hypothetical protein